MDLQTERGLKHELEDQANGLLELGIIDGNGELQDGEHLATTVKQKNSVLIIEELLQKVRLNQSTYRSKLGLGLIPVVVPFRMKLRALADRITTVGFWNISLCDELCDPTPHWKNVTYNRPAFGRPYNADVHGFKIDKSWALAYTVDPFFVAMVDPKIHLSVNRPTLRPKIPAGASVRYLGYNESLQRGDYNNCVTNPAYTDEGYMYPETFFTAAHVIATKMTAEELRELTEATVHSTFTFESLKFKDGQDKLLIADCVQREIRFSTVPTVDLLAASEPQLEARSAMMF